MINRNGNKEGRGRFWWPDKSSFDGELHNNEIHGRFDEVQMLCRLGSVLLGRRSSLQRSMGRKSDAWLRNLLLAGWQVISRTVRAGENLSICS